MKWANHTLLGVAAVLAGVLSGAAGASAQVAVIAIPGHRDVPVIINGRDASYAVVVGDWGLARPGAVPVTVYGPWASLPPDEGGYYPATGRRPRYGRQEVDAPRVIPPPAPTYHRSWSSSSRHDPASANPPPRAADAQASPGSGDAGNGPQADPTRRMNDLPTRRAERRARSEHRRGHTP